jgi:hypothetical protein
MQASKATLQSVSDMISALVVSTTDDRAKAEEERSRAAQFRVKVGGQLRFVLETLAASISDLQR